MLKQKSIICNRIASVGYAEKDGMIDDIISECSTEVQD